MKIKHTRLITTKQTKSRPVASAAPHPITEGRGGCRYAGEARRKLCTQSCETNDWFLLYYNPNLVHFPSLDDIIYIIYAAARKPCHL